MGIEHPDTANTVYCLADLLTKQGRRVEAMELVGALSSEAALEQAVEMMAYCLELEDDEVKTRLQNADSATPVRQVFGAEWSRISDVEHADEDGEVDDELYAIIGEINVEEALEDDWADYIAAVTGLTKKRVSAKLKKADKETLICDLFEEYFDPNVVGTLSAEIALGGGLTGWLADQLGLPLDQIKQSLEDASENTAIAEVFAGQWGI